MERCGTHSEFVTLVALLYNFTKEKPKKRTKYDAGPKGTCFFKKLFKVPCSSTISTLRFRSSLADCCPNEQWSLNIFHFASHQ